MPDRGAQLTWRRIEQKYTRSFPSAKREEEVHIDAERIRCESAPPWQSQMVIQRTIASPGNQADPFPTRRRSPTWKQFREYWAGVSTHRNQATKVVLHLTRGFGLPHVWKKSRRRRHQGSSQNRNWHFLCPVDGTGQSRRIHRPLDDEHEDQAKKKSENMARRVPVVPSRETTTSRDFFLHHAIDSVGRATVFRHVHVSQSGPSSPTDCVSTVHMRRRPFSDGSELMLGHDY